MAYLVERVNDPGGHTYPDYDTRGGRYRDGYVSVAGSPVAAIRDYANVVMGADTLLSDGDRFLVRQLGPKQYLDITDFRATFKTKAVESIWS